MGTLFRLFLWALAVLAVICGALYLFVFDVWRVPSDDPQLTASILPTLAPGDVMLVMRKPGIGRGELVRCGDPQAPGRFVVARAMGEGGDHVAIEGESVSIDGHHAPTARACEQGRVDVLDPNTNQDEVLTCTVEDYGEMPHPTLRGTERIEPPTRITVEKGRWFLVSDDRHFHLDSRDYGQLDEAACQHVVFRLVGAGGLFDATRRLTVVW
jgi:signal peptidase I